MAEKSKNKVEAAVLKELRTSGRTQPTELVDKVTQKTATSKQEVRETLRTLVNRRDVSLTWHGELEVGAGER